MILYAIEKKKILYNFLNAYEDAAAISREIFNFFFSTIELNGSRKDRLALLNGEFHQTPVSSVFLGFSRYRSMFDPGTAIQRVLFTVYGIVEKTP